VRWKAIFGIGLGGSSGGPGAGRAARQIRSRVVCRHVVAGSLADAARESLDDMWQF
jgi:hypothetical protein